MHLGIFLFSRHTVNVPISLGFETNNIRNLTLLTKRTLDGKGTGKIVLKNNAVANIDYYKDLTIEKDGTSTFTGTVVN